jgi:dTDP-4-dehydrorhamnose reductase
MILLTGASGYLGKALAQKLSLDKIPFEILQNSHNSPFRLGDIPNFVQLSKAQFLIHLAWDKAAVENKTKNDNYVSTIQLIDHCQLHEVKFLFISSYAVLFSPHTFYGKTKMSIENHVLDNGGYVMRTALVISEPPGSALRRLLRVQRFLPFILDRGPKSVYVHTIALAQFTKCCVALVRNYDESALVHNCGMSKPVLLRTLVAQSGSPHFFVLPVPSTVLKMFVKTLKLLPFAAAAADSIDGLYNSNTESSDLVGDHDVCG